MDYAEGATPFPDKEPAVRRPSVTLPLALALTLLHLRTAPAEPADADLDRTVEQALKSWEVPGVADAVVRDDRVIYLKGHGVRELGRHDPVTPDTIFPLASCTKAFTTTAM